MLCPPIRPIACSSDLFKVHECHSGSLVASGRMTAELSGWLIRSKTEFRKKPPCAKSAIQFSGPSSEFSVHEGDPIVRKSCHNRTMPLPIQVERMGEHATVSVNARVDSCRLSRPTTGSNTRDTLSKTDIASWGSLWFAGEPCAGRGFPPTSARYETLHFFCMFSLLKFEL